MNKRISEESADRWSTLLGGLILVAESFSDEDIEKAEDVRRVVRVMDAMTVEAYSPTMLILRPPADTTVTAARATSIARLLRPIVAVLDDQVTLVVLPSGGLSNHGAMAEAIG